MVTSMVQAYDPAGATWTTSLPALNIPRYRALAATGPDGTLYVSDDVRGRIYRITYQASAAGSAGDKVTACPSATSW